MKDSHVHTTISHDGKSSIKEYIEQAPSLGVDEITFTEHYDIYDGLKTNLKTLEVAKYYDIYKNLDTKNIKTNFGIEIGLQPGFQKKIEKMTTVFPFDFIIGSSHITCSKDMAMDKSFFEGYTRKEAYLRYFKEVLENIEIYNCFDVYGHLDYVVRYGGYNIKTISYNEFKDILDKILLTLIEKKKGIEINTSGIRYGLNNPHPNFEIIKRYKELGGKIITIGSDAHIVTDLAKDFDKAYEILEQAGFDEVAVFHNREKEFIKIKELRYKKN
ncbi:MAG TPA: histidinol-phosphatase HisJ family protein [Bacilli bacterium]|nr:histidinol-phosphatase HisJ family protein [Bacilli bacterium]